MNDVPLEKAKKPLNCPKGYGICWGCKVHCDHPQAHILNNPPQELADRQDDADFGHALGLDWPDH